MKLITSIKNDRPLYEARALVVNMCAGLSAQRSNIFASTVDNVSNVCINNIFIHKQSNQM